MRFCFCTGGELGRVCVLQIADRQLLHGGLGRIFCAWHVGALFLLLHVGWSGRVM